LCNGEVVTSYSYSGDAYGVSSYASFLQYVTKNKNNKDLITNTEFLYHDSSSNTDIYTGTILVPEKQAFLMGDNMENSHDSTKEGAIAVGDIVGRVDIILDSLKSSNVDLFIQVFKKVFDA